MVASVVVCGRLAEHSGWVLEELSFTRPFRGSIQMILESQWLGCHWWHYASHHPEEMATWKTLADMLPRRSYIDIHRSGIRRAGPGRGGAQLTVRPTRRLLEKTSVPLPSSPPANVYEETPSGVARDLDDDSEPEVGLGSGVPSL